jgi:drug/metabolite transporter (DMT)-like permease
VQHQPLGKWAFIALLAGATAIAVAPIWVRLSQVGPSATAFYRLLFALPALWLWESAQRHRSLDNRMLASRSDFVLLAAAGGFFAGDLILWHWSIRYTSVANATLFLNAAPVLVTLGASWLFRERITPLFTLGLASALVGGVLLARASLSVSNRHFLGDLLGVGTAFFYAAYLLTVKHLRARFRTSTTMAWSGLVSCPLFLLSAGLSGEELLATDWKGWTVLVALAVTAQVAGQGLITHASAHLSAAFLSVGLLFQPLVAALLGWLVFGEAIGPLQGAGGLAVLLGIGLAGVARPGTQTEAEGRRVSTDDAVR